MFKRIRKAVISKGGLIAINLALLPIVGLYGYRYQYNTAAVPDVYVAHLDRTIVIQGIITNRESDETIDLRQTSGILTSLVRAGKEEITIVINSPGGRIDVGTEFLHNMQQAQEQGVKFTCVVHGIAASMALVIFSQCDTRYATYGSKVMWHSAATNGFGKFNYTSAMKLAELFEETNTELWATTRRHFLPWYFSKHFYAETILDSSEVEYEGFGFLRVINNITAI